MPCSRTSRRPSTRRSHRAGFPARGPRLGLLLVVLLLLVVFGRFCSDRCADASRSHIAAPVLSADRCEQKNQQRQSLRHVPISLRLPERYGARRVPAGPRRGRERRDRRVVLESRSLVVLESAGLERRGVSRTGRRLYTPGRSAVLRARSECRAFAARTVNASAAFGRLRAPVGSNRRRRRRSAPSTRFSTPDEIGVRHNDQHERYVTA